MTSPREFAGKRYPTAQEIREITDLSILQSYYDSITLDVAHLEARLEFLSEDDVPKEKGIRNALAFARSAVKFIETQKKVLKDPDKGPDALTVAKAKEERARALAEQAKAAIIASKMKAERSKEYERFKAINAKNKLIKSISWHVLFAQTAHKELPYGMFSKIVEMTDAEYLKKVEEEAFKELSHPEEDES